MLDSCLLYDLKGLVEDIDLDIDLKWEECHLFIDYYRQSKNEEIVPVLKALNEGSFPSIYAELPYYLGYDSYLNGMKNYHLLIPVVTSYTVSNITDLFTLYKTQTYVREEMYDEYSMVQKHFERELEKFSKRVKAEDYELFDILIKLAVATRQLNVKYLSLLKNVEIKDELLAKVNLYCLDLIEKKGYNDIAFTE